METTGKQQQQGNKPQKVQPPRPPAQAESSGGAKPQQSNKQQNNASSDQPKQSQAKVKQGTAGTTQEPVNSIANQVYRLALFDHLPRKQTPKDPDSIEEDRIIHLATIQLGLMYQRGLIQHDDDRAQALLTTLIRIVSDYRTPPNTNLREDLDRYVAKQVQYLVESRQLSKGMGNIIRYIKLCITKISPELSEEQAKAMVVSKLQLFLDDKIIFAGESIAKSIIGTLNDDDVILTFGSSPLIRRIFTLAAETKRFRLIVVDTRPLNEGLETLAAVSSMVKCVYCPLSGTAFALKDVTKVILGASCLLSNGSMLASAGTAMVASLAKAKQIPVIIAAETYKFSDKVQLDSIVFNELGHASEIVALNPEDRQEFGVFGPQLEPGYRGSADRLALGEAQNTESIIDTADLISIPSQRAMLKTSLKPPFEVVNLRYDLTPLSNISAIATEIGLIPPTSVPILIRENQSEVLGE